MAPKALRGLWNLYFHSTVPANADPREIEWARQAFFGGISGFAHLLQELVESGDTDGALATIRKVSQTAVSRSGALTRV